ncbi:hypothetical protein, partial [Gluconobacter kanchanaburiensis]|uniref:hypothetical protein n=1 Tax=Gluconobacter kanchanaburiensis TaxID=563199 RepID=UPI00357114D0
QIVQRLDHQDFEHQHRIKRRKTSKSTVRENASSWSPRPLNRVSHSSTSKNPACFTSPFLQSEPEKWNYSVGLNTKRFLEPSMSTFRQPLKTLK